MLFSVGTTLLYRIHQRLLLGEVAEDDICVGLGHRKRWNALVAEVKYVAFVLFTEHAHFGEVDDVFSVATDKVAAFETVFDCLEAASEHVVLELTLTVCVPDLYVVIIGLDVIEVFRADRKFQCAAVVEEGNLLEACFRLWSFVCNHVFVVHQLDGVVLVDDGEVHSGNEVWNTKGSGAVYQ